MQNTPTPNEQMIESAKVLDDLGDRLAVVERRRLERENLRLASRVDELIEEMARLRSIQQLDGELFDRERSLRAQMLRQVRDLLSDPRPERVKAFLAANPPPTEEIPSFLRSAEVTVLPTTWAVRFGTRLGRYLKKSRTVPE